MKIILDGDDALNYISMVQRIKDLELLVRDTNISPEVEESKDLTASDVRTAELDQAINDDMPVQEEIIKDVPDNFIQGIEEPEEAIASQERGEENKKSSIDKEWRDFVDSNTIINEQKNKHWMDYEITAIENAVDKDSEKYYSLEVIATKLNRTVSSIKTKAINLGYRTKKGFIKSKAVA